MFMGIAASYYDVDYDYYDRAIPEIHKLYYNEDGFNTNTNPFNMTVDTETGGLYFSQGSKESGCVFSHYEKTYYVDARTSSGNSTWGQSCLHFQKRR